MVLEPNEYQEIGVLCFLEKQFISFTCLSQTISGLGNPVALHTSFTVDPFRTVILRPGLSIEITGGTKMVGGDKNFEMAYITI